MCPIYPADVFDEVGLCLDRTELDAPEAAAWRFMSTTDKSSHIRSALKSHRELQLASSKLLKVLSSTENEQNGDAIQQIARQVNEASESLNDFFGALASTSMFNERGTASEAARNVFAIPELLERILLNLSWADLLRVQQVDWTMFNTINGSKPLLRKLRLLPHDEGHQHTPFSERKSRKNSLRYSIRKTNPAVLPSDHPGFRCFSQHPNRGYFPPGQTPPDDASRFSRQIVADFAANLPKIGARCQKMLICEPPILELNLYPSCCRSTEYETDYLFRYGPLPQLPPPPPAPVLPTNFNLQGYTLVPPVMAVQPLPLTANDSHPAPSPDVETIRSETGLTVGDLYRKAKQLQEEHRLCPFAPAHMHNDEGIVQFSVNFATTIRLREDDPEVSPTWNAQAYPRLPDPFFQFNVDLDGSFGRHAMLANYVSAKRQAHEQGQKIPSFEEFKAGRMETRLPVAEDDRDES